jgi:hypothetical protein
MEEVSQLFNKVIGRNQTTNVQFWDQPERSGWLMKQGRPALWAQIDPDLAPGLCPHPS